MLKSMVRKNFLYFAILIGNFTINLELKLATQKTNLKLFIMVPITAEYKGELRTEAVHTKSGKTIITDAPPDNNGKGDAFSPTDLVCAALSSCMMTIMGMLAEREGIDLGGLKSDVVKIMASNPRRIAEIQVVFSHENLRATDVQKEKLKRAALTCPVALSLHDSIKQNVTFNF
jgi:putative redox protein